MKTTLENENNGIYWEELHSVEVLGRTVFPFHLKHFPCAKDLNLGKLLVLFLSLGTQHPCYDVS